MNYVFINRRWALQFFEGTDRDPLVWSFFTADQRDEWVAKDPNTRLAVGKRCPLVKAHRRKASGRTNV